MHLLLANISKKRLKNVCHIFLSYAYHKILLIQSRFFRIIYNTPYICMQFLKQSMLKFPSLARSQRPIKKSINIHTTIKTLIQVNITTAIIFIMYLFHYFELTTASLHCTIHKNILYIIVLPFIYNYTYLLSP